MEHTRRWAHLSCCLPLAPAPAPALPLLPATCPCPCPFCLLPSACPQRQRASLPHSCCCPYRRPALHGASHLMDSYQSCHTAQALVPTHARCPPPPTFTCRIYGPPCPYTCLLLPPHTHAECAATHCELFGDVPNRAGVPAVSANHFYRGQRYSAPIMAVLVVSGDGVAAGSQEDPLLPDSPVCAARWVGSPPLPCPTLP